VVLVSWIGIRASETACLRQSLARRSKTLWRRLRLTVLSRWVNQSASCRAPQGFLFVSFSCGVGSVSHVRLECQRDYTRCGSLVLMYLMLSWLSYFAAALWGMPCGARCVWGKRLKDGRRRFVGGARSARGARVIGRATASAHESLTRKLMCACGRCRQNRDVFVRIYVCAGALVYAGRPIAQRSCWRLAFGQRLNQDLAWRNSRY